MRRIAVLSVMAVIIMGLAIWWNSHRPDLQSPSAPNAALPAAGASRDNPLGATRADEPARAIPSAEVTEAAPSKAASSAASAADVLQLPAPGLPLRETASALLAASRAGSLPATRRLMQELTDCQRHRWASMRMDMMIAFEESSRAQRRGGDRMREVMSSAAETVADLTEHCAALPDDFDEAILFEVQRRAADAGDLAGQLAFALVPAVTLNKSLQQLDRLQIYSEYAPQFLQRALEQGSGQAVAGFMDAYEQIVEGWRGPAAQGTAMQALAVKKMMQAVRPLNPIQQVLGEDLSLGYRYALLCKRVCNGSDQARAEASIVRLETALEPAQRRQAVDAAADLYDAHFNARAQPADIDLEALKEAVLGFRR